MVVFLVLTVAGLAAAAVASVLLVAVLMPLLVTDSSGRNGYTLVGARLAFRRNRRTKRDVYVPGLVGGSP